MSKTAKRKLTAADRDTYPFNQGLMARVQMQVMAFNRAFRALEMIHENVDKAFAGLPPRLREIYEEYYADAKRCERLAELASEGRDEEAMAEYGG